MAQEQRGPRHRFSVLGYFGILSGRASWDGTLLPRWALSCSLSSAGGCKCLGGEVSKACWGSHSAFFCSAGWARAVPTVTLELGFSCVLLAVEYMGYTLRAWTESWDKLSNSVFKVYGTMLRSWVKSETSVNASLWLQLRYRAVWPEFIIN